jgi:hypothetical protein
MLVSAATPGQAAPLVAREPSSGKGVVRCSGRRDFTGALDPIVQVQDGHAEKAD